MGAGCYYTHNTTKTKAFWIDLSDVITEENYEYIMYDIEHDIEEVMTECNFLQIKDLEYVNGLYTVVFESTYYGDGLVVRIEPNEDDQRIYNLAVANHEKTSRYLAKKLGKLFNLRIATSGYTSEPYKIQ